MAIITEQYLKDAMVSESRIDFIVRNKLIGLSLKDLRKAKTTKGCAFEYLTQIPRVHYENGKPALIIGHDNKLLYSRSYNSDGKMYRMYDNLENVVISFKHLDDGDYIATTHYSDTDETVEELFNKDGLILRIGALNAPHSVYVYDDQNRLLQVKDDGGQVLQQYCYSEDGLTKTMRRSNGGFLAWELDANGKVLNKRFNGRLIKTATYDKYGNTATCSITGKSLECPTYKHNDAGVLQSIVLDDIVLFELTQE